MDREGLSPEIQRLRALPYKAYLRTDHWKEVRDRALGMAGGICRSCKKNRKLQVHHRNYTRIGNEHPRDVVALCADCHSYRHPKVARKRGFYRKRTRRG